MNQEKYREVVLGAVVALLIFSLIFEINTLVFVAILLLAGVILKLKIIHAIGFLWHTVFSRLITLISNAVLAIIYVLIFTPYSFLYRIINKKNVSTFLFGPSNESSYQVVNKIFKSKDFENPW